MASCIILYTLISHSFTDILIQFRLICEGVKYEIVSQSMERNIKANDLPKNLSKDTLDQKFLIGFKSKLKCLEK